MPFISETLTAVRHQTRKPDELVIVENQSTDGTLEFLRSEADVRLIEQPKLVSAPGNWSRAVAETTGDYVKVLCADDLIDDTMLERQSLILDRYPDVVMVVSPRRVVSPRGRVLIKRLGLHRGSYRLSSSDALCMMARHGGNPFGEVSSVMFRGAALRTCLPWPSTFGYTTDLAMYARVLRQGDLFSLDEILSSFRFGHRSWSHEARRSQYQDQRTFLRSLSDEYGLNLRRTEQLAVLLRARIRQETRRLLAATARLVDRLSSK